MEIVLTVMACSLIWYLIWYAHFGSGWSELFKWISDRVVAFLNFTFWCAVGYSLGGLLRQLVSYFTQTP